MLDNIKKESQAIQEEIVTWRRALHQMPETGVNTPLSEAYICGELDKLHIPYKKGVGQHGIVALIEGKKAGKVFALRADFDGLPIKEETGLPFASTNGCMHACGHDAHAAMLLGAAKLIKKHENDLEGSVKLIFQPGEEGCPDGPGGAKRMLDDGALENPKPDAMMGLHIGSIWNDDSMNVGDLLVHYGGMMACMDRFSITIKGKGAHGAQPNNSIDPISIAARVITGIQTIISRELDPLDPGIISICQVHAGSAFNIIPNECFIQGTVRALDGKVRKFLADRIGEIAKSTAEGMRATVDFDYNWEGPNPVVNNRQVTQEFRDVAEEILGKDKVKELPRPSMGGEDVAFFLEKVPGTFAFLNSANPAKKTDVAHHNPKFDLDEDVLWIGSAAMAGMSLTWLKNHKG